MGSYFAFRKEITERVRKADPVWLEYVLNYGGRKHMIVKPGSLWDILHAEKYRGPSESFREACNRQASALQDSAEHYNQYRNILLDRYFLPGGRIQSAIGSTRQTTAYNCFVSGEILDSFVHGHGCIMDRAKEAATTMRLGGGIGYDFSTLRPNGALIKKLSSHTAGPVAFMEIFDSVCACVSSAGHRRGAQMAVLRVDHPDIERFLHVKQNKDKLRNFNISVAATKAFMQAVIEKKSFDLVFGREVHQQVDAYSLWNMLMRSTYDWAEPGVLFIDRINEMNNLWYCETIAATNPCGEQPLPPYGACLLGSFNLTEYVVWKGKLCFDFELFRYHIGTVVRAMDNVIDRTMYPLDEQEREARSKRRMGLGVTGLANALEALGMPYGSEEFIDMTITILRFLCIEAYSASVLLAKEKGPFPLFDVKKYCDGRFIQNLPDKVKKGIQTHGIRNSHLTSIAPTGTISLTAGNVSSGIEPVYEYEYQRTINTPQGPQVHTISDYAFREWGVRGKTVLGGEIPVEDHIKVLCAAQKWVDSSISKTVNIPRDYPWDDFKQVYIQAYEGGAKGCTTYRDGGKRDSIFSGSEEGQEGTACHIDPTTGQKTCE